jgi:hypothetical protein
MKSTQQQTDKQAVQALRISSLEIAEWFVASTSQHHDWEDASNVLSSFKDTMFNPESLRTLGELLERIADEAERLYTIEDDEVEAAESLCELVSENLSTRHDKFIGRA